VRAPLTPQRCATNARGSSSCRRDLHPPAPARPPPRPPAIRSFRVANFRSDVAFRVLRNGSTLPGEPIVVEGLSAPVVNTIAARPTQGHLALDGKGRCVLERGEAQVRLGQLQLWCRGRRGRGQAGAPDGTRF
jgi:hypothetical protein